MSKFIEKIKSSTQLAPAPLGFRSAPAAEKPKILVIAAFSQSNTKNLADFTAGADAAVLTISYTEPGIQSLKRLSETSPEIPWGARFNEMDWSGTKAVNIECDFTVFPGGMPLFTLPAKTGRILEIDRGITDSMLRAIDDLPLDALFVRGKPDDSLNWQFLAELQRLDNLVSKALLVQVPAGVKGDDLLTLWRIGADGIVIDSGAGQPAGKIKELRKTIDITAFPLPRKTKKSEVMLPFIKQARPETEEEEPDEE